MDEVKRLQFPHVWISQAPALFGAVPLEARLEWIEQRWHTSVGPNRSYRFSFSLPTNHESILDRMKVAWAANGATTFRGDGSKRSAAGTGWMADIKTGAGTYLGGIVLPCDAQEAGRGLREVANTVPAYRPLVQLADQRGAQLRMVYHASFLPEPETPGPKPILERAGLLMVGNLEVQDIEERLTDLGYTVQEDEHWGVDARGPRLQIWEQEGGVHLTLNPDNHPGRML